MRTKHELEAELRRTVDAGLEATQVGDGKLSDALLTKAEQLHRELRTIAINSIGVQTMTEAGGGGLWGAITSQEFNVKSNPRVTVPVDEALGVVLKSGSFDGTIGEDTIGRVVPAPALGADSRFLYPHIPTVAVADDEANVTSYRQKSRTLAIPSDMIRAIDETGTKPETDSEAEVTALPLNQVANVSTYIPAILFNNTSFRGFVQNDVELAWKFALDAMIVDAITNAGPSGPSGSPANDFESILYAQETVQSAGYSPNLVVLSPADALAVHLLQLTGGDSYVFSQQAPAFVVTPSVSDGAGFVMDASAAATLYASPTKFETFVESAGQTNTYTARYEDNAGVQVHRSDAICMLNAT